MGTNYYVGATLAPDAHIGKSSYVGDGDHQWTWGMDPRAFDDLPLCATIRDEYGRVVPKDYVRSIVEHAIWIESRLIGQDFD